MGKGIWGWGAVGWGFICLQVRPEWLLEASAPFLVEDIKNRAPGSYDFPPILLEVKPAPSTLPGTHARVPAFARSGSVAENLVSPSSTQATEAEP